MGAYWTLFCLPLAFRFFSSFHPTIRAYCIALLTIVLFMMIGFRYEVGCDWNNYVRGFDDIVSLPLRRAFEQYEPGHVLVNLFAYDLGYGVEATNVVYGAIFVAGLIPFALRQPLPFLTLLLAVPYLITVVAMGYTRQATAIGILFFAFRACEQKRVFALIAFVVVASLFHRSALIFLVLVPIARGGRFDTVNIATVLLAPLGLLFVQGDVNQYVTGYIDSGMVSDGGFVRLALTALAGVAFFVFRSFYKRFLDYRMFLLFAIAALVSLPLNSLASTATDRMALYLMPFQIAVFARLPLAFRQQGFQVAIGAGITLVYAAQLYVWLNYAANSECWIPYSNMLTRNY